MLQKCKDVPGDPPGPDLLNYEAGHLDSREKKDNALGRGPAPRREPPTVTPDAVTPDAAPRTPAAGLASCRKPQKQQAAGRPCPEPPRARGENLPPLAFRLPLNYRCLELKKHETQDRKRRWH